MGMKETFKVNSALARGFSFFLLIAGLAVVVNVMLNFRLLRWYDLVRQSDAS
jgi:hypothetical protein